MKFLGLAALALPLAFGAETTGTCSCEIQKMFNKFAKISKDLDSKQYYMHHYNDLFHFIDDEIIPQVGITLNSEGVKWSDVDTLMGEHVPWEAEFQKIENHLKEEETQKILAAEPVRLFWNSVSTFYHQSKTYFKGTILQRSEPEFTTWITELKANDGFRVNFFSSAHAKTFHKFLVKMLGAITGTTLSTDITQILTYLQAVGIPANNFIAYMETNYGTARSIMNLGQTHQRHVNYVAAAQQMSRDAGREFEESLEEYFEFMHHNNSDWTNLFDDIEAHLGTAPNDAALMDLVSKNMVMLEKMTQDPPTFDAVKLYKFLLDVSNTAFFKTLMKEIADIPQYISDQISEPNMVDCFVKFDAALDSLGRNGRTGARAACVCNGYNGADVFKFNKMVLPVCAAAGVVNLLN